MANVRLLHGIYRANLTDVLYEFKVCIATENIGSDDIHCRLYMAALRPFIFLCMNSVLFSSDGCDHFIEVFASPAHHIGDGAAEHHAQEPHVKLGDIHLTCFVFIYTKT